MTSSAIRRAPSSGTPRLSASSRQAGGRTGSAANRKSLEEATGRTGVQQVTVLSEPRGATVVMDRQPVGVTPWTGNLTPGMHHAGLSQRVTPRSIASSSWRQIERRGPFSPRSIRKPPSPHDLRPSHSRNWLRSSSNRRRRPRRPRPVAPSHPSNQIPADSGSTHTPLVTWGWVALGTGGAALGGALIFEILRRDAQNDARHQSTQIGYANEIDTMESRQTASRILLGTGAALAATGGILLFVGLRESSHKTSPDVALACLSNGCAASVSGEVLNLPSYAFFDVGARPCGVHELSRRRFPAVRPAPRAAGA